MKRLSKKRYCLNKALKARWGGGYILVPKGFITDGASVPKVLWSLGWTPFAKDTLEAAVVHDYLYRVQAPRTVSDLIFYELMKDNGVRFLKRLTYLLAVRVGGVFAYARWRVINFIFMKSVV
jgi:hypothetical protein